jgi:4-azaleucine resistance transporter AzlC
LRYKSSAMTSTTAMPGSAPLSQFLLGARMFVPVAISIAAYGVVWGVLAGQAGMSVAEVILMSTLVFAGASQFVALDMWTPGALPVGAIIFATAIVNLRMLLMTATLRPLAAGLPKVRAALAMHFVADENWALTMTEVAKGRGSIAFLLGGGVLSALVWLTSTLGGRLLGSAIDDPARYGLDFAFTATFIALLFGMWKGKADLLPWIVAALAAVVAARLIPGNWYIIIGGLVGSLAGALADHRKPREERSTVN